MCVCVRVHVCKCVCVYVYVCMYVYVWVSQPDGGCNTLDDERGPEDGGPPKGADEGQRRASQGKQGLGSIIIIIIYVHHHYHHHHHIFHVVCFVGSQ